VLSAVLDASALLAYLRDQPGADAVADAQGRRMSFPLPLIVFVLCVRDGQSGLMSVVPGM
jgi:hypothetical protein